MSRRPVRLLRTKPLPERDPKDIRRWSTQPGMQKCRSTTCLRQVTRDEYCCHGCEMAHAAGYEPSLTGPLGHSGQCNVAHEFNGPVREA